MESQNRWFISIIVFSIMGSLVLTFASVLERVSGIETNWLIYYFKIINNFSYYCVREHGGSCVCKRGFLYGRAGACFTFCSSSLGLFTNVSAWGCGQSVSRLSTDSIEFRRHIHTHARGRDARPPDFESHIKNTHQIHTDTNTRTR